VGTLLARAFHADLHDVVVLSRHPRPASWRVVAWDARTLGSWTSELDDADVVVNLAGRNVNRRYTPANRHEILDSRVASARVVGQAIARCRHPPRVWLQASTATIYAHRFDGANDEATGMIGGHEPDAPAKWRFSIEVATAWEAAANETTLDRTRLVLLRSAMIMSPDPGGIFVRRGQRGRAEPGAVSRLHANLAAGGERADRIARDTMDARPGCLGVEDRARARAQESSSRARSPARERLSVRVSGMGARGSGPGPPVDFAVTIPSLGCSDVILTATRTPNMRYALLIHYPQPPAIAITEEQMAAGRAGFNAYAKALDQAGVLRSAEILQTVGSATSVSVKQGKLQVQDGPFADTKEAFAGMFVIDVPDLDAAIAWAERCPAAQWGTIEIRPSGVRFVEGAWVNAA